MMENIPKKFFISLNLINILIVNLKKKNDYSSSSNEAQQLVFVFSTTSLGSSFHSSNTRFVKKILIFLL
ncbi:hypothetical protein BpHYR1_028085 [Brachionus plicatilis]|uniref:Uncharacterized protein n=1 Tax=Brachionus plicatilis TaxID=10195 RepID=A0A3M7PPI7_BRAPC|nr:hypothetical protein BpHYR1_028085 [Brachionus plicatilis]